MKILLISDFFIPSPRAGVERLCEFVNILTSRGHKVYILSQENLYSNKKNRISTKFDSKFKSFYNPILFILLSWHSYRLVKQNKIEMLITSIPTINPLISSLIVSRVLHIPFILDYRDYWEGPLFFYRLRTIIPQTLGKFVIIFFSFLYKLANAVMCDCFAVKKILIKRGVDRNKIHIIENGADPTKYFSSSIDKNKIRKKYGLPQSKIIFVYAGSLAPSYYDINLLLKAMSLLESKKNEAFLLIISQTVTKFKEYEDFIQQLNLKYVKILGPFSQKETANILSACNVGLIPMKRNNIFRAILPIKLFSYFASGLPVIVSGPPNGALLSWLKENNVGFLIEKESPVEFAKAMEFYIINRSLIRNIGKNRRTLIETRYDKRILSKEILNVVQSVS